tara:strand:- start:1380 stop:2582 length:1203 start_codon:yes stop_codon:yes gene_type:complete
MAAYEYINLNGSIVPDTEQTKTEVQDEYKEVLGSDLDTSDETPGGVLVNAETISRNGVATNNAKLANQINPRFSGGKFLDSVWALTAGITGGRRKATFSIFPQDCDLTGVPGTVIPQGAVALAGDNEFESLSEVTIDAGGNATVAFKSVETGPIPAAIGELNTVAPGQPLGWESITNPVSATQGQNTESDEASRLRRNETLSLQNIAMSESIISALNNIDGVKSVSYRENYTDTDQVIDGIFLKKNSVYACVDGGSDSNIGEALLKNKSGGAGWNGSETVPTIDEESGQSYDVMFDRPAETASYIRVTIAQTTVSNPASVVETSVLRYANGEMDGEKGFVVGGDVSAFEISGAVNRDTPEIFVKNVELSTDGITYTNASILIALDEVARTNEAIISTVVS